MGDRPDDQLSIISNGRGLATPHTKQLKGSPGLRTGLPFSSKRGNYRKIGIIAELGKLAAC